MSKKPVTARSIKIIAEISSYDNGNLRGTLDSIYFEEPHSFAGVVEMIDIMETMFDALGFPDKNFLPRTFGKAEKRMRRHEVDLEKLLAERSRTAQAGGGEAKAEGVLAAFEIFVSFRRNAEWQGKLHVAGADETFEFSSIVDMVKLMDEAVYGKAGKEQKTK